MNPHAPAEPRLTTWLVVRGPVADPAAPVQGAPGGGNAGRS